MQISHSTRDTVPTRVIRIEIRVKFLKLYSPLCYLGRKFYLGYSNMPTTRSTNNSQMVNEINEHFPMNSYNLRPQHILSYIQLGNSFEERNYRPIGRVTQMHRMHER